MSIVVVKTMRLVRAVYRAGQASFTPASPLERSSVNHRGGVCAGKSSKTNGWIAKKSAPDDQPPSKRTTS